MQNNEEMEDSVAFLIKEIVPEKVFRIPELSEEKKFRFEQSIMQYPKHADKFDECGIRYDINWLNSVGCMLIVYPLEYMATYVDRICHDYTNEEDQEFYDAFNDDSEHASFETLNATAIGNYAYIALNCKNEKASKKAMEKLNEYLEWAVSSKSLEKWLEINIKAAIDQMEQNNVNGIN